MGEFICLLRVLNICVTETQNAHPLSSWLVLISGVALSKDCSKNNWSWLSPHAQPSRPTISTDSTTTG